MVLEWILFSTFLVSFISLIGVLALSISDKSFKKIVLVLVSLSAGALIGGAFIHLIPEALESGTWVISYVLVGFILFFFIEKVFYWRHCHDGKCDVHTFAYMNLFGEAVHNFIDGLVIAAGFLVSIPLGITTTIAVALHEVPQELGDFGVLIHGGFKKSKALILNFLTALTCIAGGLLGFYLSSLFGGMTLVLVSIAAGGFIYIGASDLIPEIKEETNTKKSLITFIVFVLGVSLMFGLTFV